MTDRPLDGSGKARVAVEQSRAVESVNTRMIRVRSRVQGKKNKIEEKLELRYVRASEE